MIVGLTGGIGSGKSTVAKLFELLGCLVFESDKAARDIYSDPLIRQQVVALLGKESYLPEQTIDKTFISSKIFSDANLLKQLNAIIHPAVIEQSKRFAAAHPDRIVIKETALLFEAGLENDVDTILLVAADDETRIQRVMARDTLSREEVIRKINSQLSQEEKIKRSDLVIYNDESELLIPQVLKAFASLSKKTHA